MKFGARPIVGIAAGAHALTASVRRGSTSHVRTVEVDAADADSATLAAAFRDLRAQLHAAGAASLDGAAAHIALLPPLADARLVALPPLRPAEAAAVVQRDAARYFIGVAAPRLVGVRMPDRRAVFRGDRRSAARAPALTAAASAVLVEKLAAAAHAAGWRTAAFVPAHAAWTAAASTDGTVAQVIVAVHDDTAHVARLVAGTLLSLRRIAAADITGIVAAAADADNTTSHRGRVTVFAEPTVRTGITRAFENAGWSAAPATATAAEAAARYAGAASVQITPPALLQERVEREGRAAVRLTAAAVVLLIAAAAVELWGTNRELDRIRERRAEIRADVAPLLALRDSINQLSAYTADIEALAAATPRWTAALFDVALLLPPEAYLTGLFATGDTLVMEAQGAGAGAALHALRSSETLRDARLLGTIERELADGTTAAERFRIRAQLDRPHAVADARRQP